MTGARYGRRTAAVLLPLLVALILPPQQAWAGWSTSGSGSGTATVGSLAAPGAVTATAISSTVTVAWDPVTPPSGTLEGYLVTRHDGSSAFPACGSGPADLVTETTCTDAGVPNGTYSYTVTAVWRSWTATSPASGAVTVVLDPTAPTQSLALAPGADGAALVGGTLWFRSPVPGSFRIDATVTDLGSGPASAAFPAVVTPGWTHAAETVTTGSGTATSRTYTSSPYSWTAGAGSPGAHSVTGRDLAGNSVQTTVSLQADAAPPTGGALTVNAVPATAGGSRSVARADFTLTRTDYGADVGSGLVSSVLTREAAPVSGATCGIFGAPVVLVGAPLQTGLTTGCYRYTLTGTDRVGNVASLSTTVVYDLVPPAATVSVTSSSAAVSGSTVFFRDTVAGSFVLHVEITDQESGPLSAAFPQLNRQGWGHNAETVTIGTGTGSVVTYSSSPFVWDVGARRQNNYSVTVTDQAGNTTVVPLAFTVDSTAPTGGSLTVNGTAASAAGTTSTSATGSFTITRSAFADAGAGMASDLLTVEVAPYSGGTCGAFGAPSLIVASPPQSGLATGCYRYTLTGTDRVGNAVAVSTTVTVQP